MLLTRADKWLIGILVLVAAGGIIWNMAALSRAPLQRADIYKEGNLVKSISLRPGYQEEVRLGGDEHYNIVVADNGAIRITESDCPDQICVRTGWIRTAPQQIVCLPYRVVIKLESTDGPSDIDDIAR